MYFSKHFIISLLLLDAQIAISLGFYKELFHFLESFFGVIFNVFAGVKITLDFPLQFICQDAPKLILGSFGPSGGVSW